MKKFKIDTTKVYLSLGEFISENDLEDVLIKIYGKNVYDEDDYIDWGLIESEQEGYEKVLEYLKISEYIISTDGIHLMLVIIKDKTIDELIEYLKSDDDFENVEDEEDSIRMDIGLYILDKKYIDISWKEIDGIIFNLDELYSLCKVY